MDNNKWLHGEIDKWLSMEIITEDTADKISGLYEEKNKTLALTIIFSIIGALFVGTGIILISAKNWYNLPIWVRCCIAFLPLIAAQALSVYVLLKRMTSKAWREGTALFLSLTIFTSIALIGQIFHLPGDFGVYALTCGLLSLPIIYILNATSPTVIYIWTILNWYALSDGFNNIWGYEKYLLIVLILLVVPFIFSKIKKNKFGARGQLLSWLSAVAGILATFFICVPLTETNGSIIAIPLGICFVLFYLFDAVFYRKALSYIQQPFKIIGWLGITVMLFIYSYSGLWKYTNMDTKNIMAISLIPYIILCLIYLSAIVWMFTKSKDKLENFIASIGLLLPAMILLANIFNFYDYIPAIIINVALLAIGVLIIFKGVEHTSLGYTNIGMASVCLLVVLRFFDWEMNLFLRGVTFILIGIGFLLVNLYIIKKRKAVQE